MGEGLTRRQALQAGAAAGASAMVWGPLISRALANPPNCGSLGDIQHVVILIQENRSFDHYFGSHFGVTGFGDPSALLLNDGIEGHRELVARPERRKKQRHVIGPD